LTHIPFEAYLVAMASSLRQQLSELAASFANDVMNAIRSASIEDLLAESPGAVRRAAPARAAARTSAAVAVTAAVRPAGGGRARGGRLARRSAGDIAKVIDRIVGLLRQSPRGLRAEQIRQRLSLQSKELPRPLKEAVDAGRLGKSGQKRATTYFVKGAGGPVGGARRGVRKAARKK
jgi:hypothetical protein